MYSYSVFGLSISSDLYLPEFLLSESTPDIYLKFGNLIPPETTLEGPVRVIGPMGDGILLHWSEIGSFLVERGETVTISPVPGADEALIRLMITGPVLGVLLHQRGFRVFHAAVVHAPLDDGAVAFFARKGGGKSTMLGAMCSLGYRLMSDDILALSVNGNRFIAASGFPHTKLWKESSAALGQDFFPLTDSVPGFEKQGRVVDDCFYPDPAPLRAVFILEYGDEMGIEHLSGKEALMAVLPHWYGALFDGQLLELFGRREHFLQSSELIRRLPVYRLLRPKSLERLHDTAVMVADFLQNDLKDS